MTNTLQLTLVCICFCSIVARVLSLEDNSKIPPPPCEVIFPKMGDMLVHTGSTYNLLMCHFSTETELLLDQEKRHYSVIIQAFVVDRSTLEYVKVFEFPPVLAISPRDEVHKTTTLSELYFSPSVFNVNVQYKLVYQIYIGDKFIDQIATVVTYKDNSYFRKQLGIPPIELVNVNELCDIDEGEACPLLESVRDSLFTESFDFIEVGTSAFDTCLQKAENHHHGISVEPLAVYQDMLPSPPGVIKENAAMDAKTTDPDVDFGLMYFLDPRDLIALGYTVDGPHFYMFGISSFGSIQTNLVNSYRLEGVYTPLSIFLQQSRLVPRLSMEELYTKHAVREVGVVKLDCEGLDIAIVTTYLDMLQKYHLPYPSILSYEVVTSNNKEFWSMVSRLQHVGYSIISLSHPVEKAAAGDFVAIHADCPPNSKRRRDLSPFLPEGLEKAERLCEGNRKGNQNHGALGYCCVTRHGGEDDRMELCNSLQPFFMEFELL